MSILKIAKRDHPYAQIDNATLRDENLSWKARGLLAYLLSLPDDWEVRVNELVNHSKYDGRKSTYRALSELRDAGYVELAVARTSDNSQIAGTRWTVRERPASPNGACRFGACRNGTTKNTYSDEDREHKRRSAAGGVSFNLSPEGQIEKLCERFAQFTIKHRLFVGKQGSTRSGWTARTIRRWARPLEDLLEQANVKEIERVMDWYFEHFGDQYVPITHTLPGFCLKFMNYVKAMARGSGNGTSRPKRQSTVRVNGVEVEPDDED